MYTLLAVFCVAVVVFGVNCAVFMAKHRGKGVASASSPRKTTYTHSSRKSSKLGVALLIGGKKRSEGSETVDGNVIGGAASAAAANCSPDWVWIGREILERNAIETACSKALMPDEEFQNAAVNKTSTGPIVATGTSGDPQAPLSSSSATTTATTNLASADNSPSPLVNSSVCRGDFNQTLPPQYHQVFQGCYDLDKTAATFAEGEDDDVDDDDDNDDDEDDDDEQDDNGMEGSQINNKGNEDCSCEILTAREKGHSAVTEKSKVVHRATRLTNHSYKHPKISTNRVDQLLRRPFMQGPSIAAPLLGAAIYVGLNAVNVPAMCVDELGACRTNSWGLVLNSCYRGVSLSKLGRTKNICVLACMGSVRLFVLHW